MKVVKMRVAGTLHDKLKKAKWMPVRYNGKNYNEIEICYIENSGIWSRKVDDSNVWHLKSLYENKLNEQGRRSISLGGTSVSLAKCVCESFHGTGPEHYECHHKDENRKNDNPDNLEWISSASNKRRPKTNFNSRFPSDSLYSHKISKTLLALIDNAQKGVYPINGNKPFGSAEKILAELLEEGIENHGIVLGHPSTLSRNTNEVNEDLYKATEGSEVDQLVFDFVKNKICELLKRTMDTDIKLSDINKKYEQEAANRKKRDESIVQNLNRMICQIEVK